MLLRRSGRSFASSCSLALLTLIAFVAALLTWQEAVTWCVSRLVRRVRAPVVGCVDASRGRSPCSRTRVPKQFRRRASFVVVPNTRVALQTSLLQVLHDRGVFHHGSILLLLILFVHSVNGPVYDAHPKFEDAYLVAEMCVLCLFSQQLRFLLCSFSSIAFTLMSRNTPVQRTVVTLALV